jgi:hypothetical protein
MLPPKVIIGIALLGGGILFGGLLFARRRPKPSGPNQVGAIGHELLHNSSLVHGGPVDSSPSDVAQKPPDQGNFLPNQLSSMNHGYQSTGMSEPNGKIDSNSDGTETAGGDSSGSAPKPPDSS